MPNQSIDLPRSGSFWMFLIVIFAAFLLFGPANIAAFMKSPGLYAIVIAIIVALFLARRI